MQDEQKQIEEMAKVIRGIMYYTPDEEDDRYRYLTHLDKKSAKEISEKLYAAGYRKQSETAREILQKLYNETEYFSFQYTIKELAAQYGVEVEE